ncbi:hypothetical protein [Legionella septentrionalis]|uniref:hypothetical protein n=1 Tax=Legionella septentrionalis TaxID=2498109 RepID=UPI000F8F1951|nr:hypothetical protein [Legionella septentrionalis]RUR09616.1 hypothetical protein ELY14_07965 [Legionella septentrionalis]
MNTPFLSSTNELIQQAEHALTNSLSVLKDLAQHADALPGSDSVGGRVQTLQLILQYRLDTQDALLRLLHIEQTLLQVLGIAPQHSSRINMERIAFALGHDDLRHILHALSQLIDSLAKIANRMGSRERFTDQVTHQQALKASNRYLKFQERLQSAAEQQKRFVITLDDIHRNIKELVKREAIGPVLDHIAALRGPISQFFQAVQNGLGLSHALYEKTNKNMGVTKELSILLQQADLVLREIPALHPRQTLLSPAKMSSPDRLEERATAKRMGHFFHL